MREAGVALGRVRLGWVVAGALRADAELVDEERAVDGALVERPGAAVPGALRS
jgi:hypothetical protein